MIDCNDISDEEFRLLDDYEEVDDHINKSDRGEPCDICLRKVGRFSQEGIRKESR